MFNFYDTLPSIGIRKMTYEPFIICSVVPYYRSDQGSLGYINVVKVPLPEERS